MTSSENLPSIETWPFRSAFADSSWLSEVYSRDTEILTKALEKSFSNNANNDYNCNSFSELLDSDLIAPFIRPETPTVSNVSGSEPDMLPKPHRRALPGLNGGRITKRKPRARKKTQTTFITADPANFRQMVQQVTGIRIGNPQLAVAQVLKPEPQRLGVGRFTGIDGGWLPTLDTSAFLLDHQQTSGSGHFDVQTALVGEGASCTGLDFDPMSSFPTLESCDSKFELF